MAGEKAKQPAFKEGDILGRSPFYINRILSKKSPDMRGGARHLLRPASGNCTFRRVDAEKFVYGAHRRLIRPYKGASTYE